MRCCLALALCVVLTILLNFLELAYTFFNLEDNPSIEEMHLSPDKDGTVNPLYSQVWLEATDNELGSLQVNSGNFETIVYRWDLVFL